jgi:predicted phage terminase large subunit-like protein
MGLIIRPEEYHAILRSDPYAYLQKAFPIVAPGSTFLRNWHLQAIMHLLERVRRGEVKRAIITVPPRSLKSICASVVFPSFLLGHDPSCSIICASYSERLAKKHSSDFRRLIKSEANRRIFPRTLIDPIKDTELEIATTQGGYRLAASVEGTLTGRGADIIIIDDPLKQADGQSDAARANVYDWFSNTIISRLNDKLNGGIIVVMQRVHAEDLVGSLLAQGGWEHLCLPAIAVQDEHIPIGDGLFHFRQQGTVLHPEREPIEVLEALRRDMGSMVFEAQYQQCPIIQGGNLIKTDWFSRYDQLPPTCNPEARIIVSFDTAMNAKEISDYSVGVVFFIVKGNIYIADIIRERLEYPDLKRRVVEVYNQWTGITKYQYLVIENKGSGMSLIQDLKRDGIHARPYEPDNRDKVMRAHDQLALLESGAVYLPRSAPWLQTFEAEVEAFPASRYDDQVDALVQGLAFAQRHAKVTTTRGLIGLH